MEFFDGEERPQSTKGTKGGIVRTSIEAGEGKNLCLSVDKILRAFLPIPLSKRNTNYERKGKERRKLRKKAKGFDSNLIGEFENYVLVDWKKQK